MNKVLQIGIIVVLIFAGCKNKKKTAQTPSITAEYEERNELIEAIDSACCKFEGMEIKTGLKLDLPSQKVNNLKAIFRVNTDSVIWASVTYSGIAVGNALFTVDSIKLLVRQPKKTYYLGTYDDINQQFGLQLNYTFLQDFLYARPLEFENSEHMMLRANDEQYEFKNSGPSKTLGLEQVTKVYKFSKTNLTYSSLEAESKKDSVTLNLTYEKYEKLENCLFPNLITMDSKKGKNESKIVLDINKISVGKQSDMPFKLTDSYERIKLGK